MNYAEAYAFLKQCHQEHLLAFWDTLSPPEQASLLAQIATLDFDAIAHCASLLQSPQTATPASITPAHVTELTPAEREAASAIGAVAIR